MTRYAGVVFDLDGTLVFLDVDIEQVRARVASLFADAGVQRRFSPLLANIDEAAEEVGGEGGQRLRAQALELISAAEIEAARTARPRSGAVELLRAASRVAAVAVVTNNSRRAAELALRSLVPGLAPVILGREDSSRPKPDPQGMIEAITRLDVEGAVLVVGDSPMDVRAARAAGAALGRELEVAVVTGGRAEAAELVALGPDLMVGEPAELVRRIFGS